MSHTLLRDCVVTEIPAGRSHTLTAGSEVHIVQTLGGHITVRASEGLYRIAAVDASALAGYTPEATPAPEAGPAAPEEFSTEVVWAALRTCFDPEIPLNIVDLGLIYDLAIEPAPEGGHLVEVKMTLTAPGCGMGPVIAEDARQKISALPGVHTARVHVVWDPIWTPQMISPHGRGVLGLE